MLHNEIEKYQNVNISSWKWKKIFKKISSRKIFESINGLIGIEKSVNSFNPSVAILAVTSAKTDKIFWKNWQNILENIWRNIVQMVNTNNFSSNIFPSALQILRKCVQMMSSAEVGVNELNKKK
jgi:hypothetical protein